MKKYALLSSLLSCLLFIHVAKPLDAQPSAFFYGHREPGDRAIRVKLGMFFPLFFQSLQGNYAKTNLSLGGSLGLDIDTYLTKEWILGGSIMGNFAFSPNMKMLLLLPITVKGAYVFNLSPFSFQVGLGTGISMTMLKSASYIDFVLIPSLNTSWAMNSTWSLGLETAYMMFFQFYFGEKYDQSRIGNFVPVTFTLTYHF